MSSDGARPPGEGPRRGLLLVISSPSGAGKSSLSQRLLETHPELTLSVSATTRAPRAGEVDGREYHFLAREEFEKRRDAGWFYEWAVVHGNLYGTPKGPVRQIFEGGRDVLLDIDWQGAQQLIQQQDQDVVSVFILPPSMDELEARLRKRAQDSDAVIQQRLEGAVAEMTHWGEYDYVLLNEVFEETAAKLDTILRAERLRRDRQTWLTEFTRGLLA
jgi:guanylate kinase